MGLLENIELITKYFPEAYTFVYIGNDVPESFQRELQPRHHVILRYTHETGPKNMIQRFFAIDEPEVDVMFVRDADSRVHWKDRWAIREFLANPTAKLHIIRDNPQHITAIMGGLWGMKKIDNFNIRSMYGAWTSGHDHGMGVDQNFLIDCVYPKVTSVMLIHSSQIWRYHPNEVLNAFPFAYTNDIYCGRIETPIYSEPTQPFAEKPKAQGILNMIQRNQPLVKLYS
jgi:hypothetical protein